MRTLNDEMDYEYLGHKFVKTEDGIKDHWIYRDYTYKCVKCDIFIILGKFYGPGNEMYNYVDGKRIRKLNLSCGEYIIKGIIE